jgi:hypothetical protein
MKNLVFLFLILFFASCTNQKKVMNAWLGTYKEILIRDWGAPDKTLNLESSGEILVYAKEMRYKFSGPGGPSLDSGPSGPSMLDEDKRWEYTFFKIDGDGLVYDWEKQVYQISPEEINFSALSKKKD